MKKSTFEPNEKITVNTGFTSPNIRVNFVPIVTHKKTEKDITGPDPVDPIVKIERQNIIDAVVVRIMKARKTEKHLELIQEVIRQISMFLPEPVMIKQRIESLIEREYLKRDDNDRSKYIYLP